MNSLQPARPASEDRVSFVDVAKGICIALVVTMHSTLGVGAEMGGTGFLHEVVAFAKPFRMPDFFLIAGLFLSRVIDRDLPRFVDRRVLHFAYFYVLWLAIQSAAKYGQVSDGSPAGFARHLLVGLVEPYSTLWFIYLLAVFSLVARVLRTLPAPIVLAAATALQIMPVETPSFLYNEFCERWVFFLVGWLFASRILAFGAWAGARPGLAVPALCAWGMLNGIAAFTPAGFWGAGTLAELPVVGLGLGLAGALAVVAAAALLAGTAPGRAVAYLGRHSLPIYLAFFLPMAIARTLLVRSGAISDVGIVSALVTLAGLICPLLLERAVRGGPLRVLFERPAAFRLGGRREASAARLNATG